MDCDEVKEKLGDYLDEEALKELCRAIEEHLTFCRNCKVDVDTVRKTIVLYQSDREFATPVTIDARLRAALALEYARGKSPAD